VLKFLREFIGGAYASQTVAVRRRSEDQVVDMNLSHNSPMMTDAFQLKTPLQTHDCP
jgi:hypothetical protein